jgi:uncharacterized protein YciI
LVEKKEEKMKNKLELLKENLDEKSVKEFNLELAKGFDADKYGMKKYVMALLKRGENRNLPKEEAEKLQMAHLANINRLAEMGKLVLAGPFLDDGDLRGIYIFAVESIEEAEELTNTDPAIIKGSLKMELHPWYGSAALGVVNDLHSAIAEVNI